MGAVGPEQPTCVETLQAAIAAGAVDGTRAAARHCRESGTDVTALERVLVAADRCLSSGGASVLQRADALRAALTALQLAGQSPPLEVPSEALTGTVLLATLPGDRHDVGRHLWRGLLARRGFEVRDLAVRAPALIAAHAVAASAPGTTVAVGVYAFDSGVRPALQSLVAHLLRRARSDATFTAPLLIGGPGVDEAFARWVAIPEGGTPYWGGVYYCEDGAEMLQVLRQIVLFKPPPPAHVHDAEESSEGACGSCGGCALAAGRDVEVAEG